MKLNQLPSKNTKKLNSKLLLFTLLILAFQNINANIDYGVFYLKLRGTYKYLDANAGQVMNNTGNIQLWDYAAGYTNQKWILEQTPTGTYFIKNMASGKCLDAARSTHNTNGGLVFLWQNVKTLNQQWNILPTTSGLFYKIKCASGGKLLSVNRRAPFANGQAIQVFDENIGLSQEWELIKVAEKLQTKWFYPTKKRGSGGDNDFFGNGPQIEATLSINLRGGNQIWASVFMNAKEVGGANRDIFNGGNLLNNGSDGTEAEGGWEELIYTANPGEIIESIENQTTATFSFKDKTHKLNYLTPANGEQTVDTRNLDFTLPGVNDQKAVRFAVFNGDTEGADFSSDPANPKTNGAAIKIIFNDLMLRISNLQYNTAQVILPVPEENYGCGESTCGATSGSAITQFYGVNKNCADVWQQINSVPHIINTLRSLSIANLGTNPPTLTDILNRNSPGFTLNHAPNNEEFIQTLNAKIAWGKKPVLLLTGWGSRCVRDYFADPTDPYGISNAALHFVVVRGVDIPRKLYYIVDNGIPKCWSKDYLLTVFNWGAENFAITEALNNVGTRTRTYICK